MSRPARYTFILALVGLGTLLAAVGGWRYARASAPVNGPIILIAVDALRADRLPIYGTPGTTPNIDALAADGIVFEHAYAQVPQTLPSHASLLTGRLPHENGVRDGVGFTLKPAERTLAEMLADRGYATGGVVSSFLLRPGTGISQGFMFFDADFKAPGSNEKPPLLRAGDDSEKIAERWFDSLGTSRALLFLQLADLLGPIDSAHPASYDARVTAADQSIGRLTQYLKTHQLYDRATIILFADHGEGLGDHGEQGHGLLTYDEALHVPLVIKQPGGELKGRRIADVVRLVDIVPTVLDLTKAPIPGNLNGRSLTPLLGGGTATPVMAYGESNYGHYHFGWAGLTTITDGRYRYIDAPRPELYDLKADPHQEHNIAETTPKVAADLRAALKDLSGQGPLPKMTALPLEDRISLETLGYVGTYRESATPAEPMDPKDGVQIVEQFRTAVSRLDQGNLAGAIDGFQTLAKETPDNPDVWGHLAAVATRAERHDLAFDAWKHAALLLPSEAAPQLAASAAALRVRKLDEARRLAEETLQIPQVEPANAAAAHEMLARIALARRNVEDAKAEAAKAEEILPARPVVAYVAGRIAFDRKRYAEALESFEPALAALNKTPDARLADLRLLTAESLAATDRYSEAEYLFMRELADSPQSARAKAGLVALYKATGRATEAAALSH